MTFNPKMLTLAREAAGLTQGVLAQDCGVSQATISKIEHGLESPSPAVIERLAVRCEVPPSFLDQSDGLIGEGLVDMFHKKRATLPAKPLKQANALANVARLQALRLLRTVELMDVQPFPNFPVAEHGSIEEIGQMVRATWRVPRGPLPDLVALVEAAAVPVFLFDLGHEKVRALSMPGLEGRHVIVLNKGLPPSAQRFALAHEIGHLVMHDGTGSENMEKEADAFASTLLMPRDDIRPQLRNIRFRDLGPLKSIWRVSLAALIYRAHDLGMISDRHRRTLYMDLSQLPGGRKREPGEFEAEQPRLLRYLIDHYKDDFGYSGEDICGLLSITEDMLMERYYDQPSRRLRAVGSEQPRHVVSMPCRT